MILQSLCGYYDRLAEEPSGNVPVMGYEVNNISSCITLDADGNVVGVISLLNDDKKPVKLITPIQPKRAGQRPEPAFLCENPEFIFGIYKNEAGADYRFHASKEMHEKVLKNVDDVGATAVLSFFEKREKGRFSYIKTDTTALESGGNIIFRLKGEDKYIHERPAIKNAWMQYLSQKTAEAEIGQCLITGETAPIARLHGNVGGFGADKPTLVAFKQDSFVSYRKVQGANAPVSELAAFKYITALDSLISDRNHRINLFGDKVVFWAERNAPLEESAIGYFFGGKIADANDNAGSDETVLNERESRKIKSVLASLYTGKNPEELGMDASVRFYILGISSNKTRLVIRFFYTDTFGVLINRLLMHYNDIGVTGPEREPENPSLFQILLETAVNRDRKNVPPTLESALIRSILWGTPYSYSLFIAILNRIRAEANNDSSKAINRTRVGVLKGYLNRMSKFNNNGEMVTMALNEQETNTAYLLGRIFALLEKAQYDALGKVNASIVDKYLNSALATPQTVFPMLLTLAEKHISKSEKYYIKMQIGKIVDMISTEGFPQTLNSEEQGKFMIGYYHQRQALYTKNITEPEVDNEGGNENV